MTIAAPNSAIGPKAWAQRNLPKDKYKLELKLHSFVPNCAFIPM